MSMHLFWCVLALVPALGTRADLPADGALSSTILSGPMFFVSGLNTTNEDLTGHSILLVTNDINGAPLNGPELRVVVNTTVYFNITGIWTQDVYYYPVAFGLTQSSSTTLGQPFAGDALGLTPTPASVSARACYSYVPGETGLGASATSHVKPNTFGLNYTSDFNFTSPSLASTGYRIWSTTACVLQWQVPANAAEANTNYYYFEPFRPSTPRRIHIVAADPNIPSTGSGSGSGTGTGSGSNNSTTTTTSPPTTNATSAPTGTGSSSPTPNGTSTSTSSSTGSKTPSSASASAHLSGWAGIPLVAALAAISAAAASL